MSSLDEVAQRRRVAMEGEKVVYSRSQLLCSATKPLEDAFEVFVPESKQFMNSDTELWNFLCSLKNDFSPVVLRSKDVYGYSSSRSVVPDPSLISRGKSKDKPAAQPKKPPVQRKRKGARLTLRKRRRGRTGGSEESGTSSTSGGSSVCSSPTPSELPGLLGMNKSLEDMWKAANHKQTVFPSIRVTDVSCEAKVAAARVRAQKILRVNLQPVVVIKRSPILSPS
ncbi:coiled-coil domain-containing protein 71L [Pelobates fuscus]|uniref:coiled-coil domain-containing protein 71L n=1 Tax=Pelobates fuscus TaxID=191477 RepID=UPI002FE4B779